MPDRHHGWISDFIWRLQLLKKNTKRWIEFRFI